MRDASLFVGLCTTCGGVRNRSNKHCIAGVYVGIRGYNAVAGVVVGEGEQMDIEVRVLESSRESQFVKEDI